MKNRNGYYLEFDIVRNRDKVHNGTWVTFSSSLNAAKQSTKGFYHRTKGTRFNFTKVICLGENFNLG
jgi:hypothetical protein